MKHTDTNTRLDTELDRLSPELTPEHDLWPGIEHSLKNHRQSTLPVWGIAAAAAMFSVVLTYAVMRPQPQSSGAEMNALLALLQSEHEANKQSLLVSYQDSRPFYPDWQEQLQQLEEAEKVILAALADEPTNIELLTLLRQVQHKQLDLIETVYAPRFSSI